MENSEISDKLWEYSAKAGKVLAWAAIGTATVGLGMVAYGEFAQTYETISTTGLTNAHMYTKVGKDIAAGGLVSIVAICLPYIGANMNDWFR